VVYDSLGKPVTVDITATYHGASSAGTQWDFTAESADNKAPGGKLIVGTGTLAFDTEGKLISATGANLAIDRTGTGSKTPLSVKIDFGGMTALASNASNMVVSRQDGSPLGSLSTFSVGTDGVVTGSFSNGLTRVLGQVAVATFSNPEGLNDQGGNLYQTSADSGTPVIGTPLHLGAGALRAGALEQSNVDLSTEFVNMIVASTGFNASSRVISTSNQLLTDLLSSVR
jgi:flagellar hook protein FlgE